jgi:DNA-binding CsgD family transcriptional regulator
MDRSAIERVMNIWELENKIIIPHKAKIFVEIVDQLASLFSVGPFYYYLLNFENLKMELVHGGIQEVLGIEPDQFSLQKGMELMHPEDLAKLSEKESAAIHFFQGKVTTDEIPLYKVVYMFRLKHTSGIYKTILHQAKALSITEDGKIQFVLGIHTDVSFLNIPFNHDISFISTQLPSFYAIRTENGLEFTESWFKGLFSHREIEIIQHLSMGQNFNQIAQQLYVSPHTINTHKKNILNKSGCKNTAELIAKSIREGII